jgi:hypothetical protein
VCFRAWKHRLGLDCWAGGFLAGKDDLSFHCLGKEKGKGVTFMAHASLIDRHCCLMWSLPQLWRGVVGFYFVVRTKV